MTKYQYEEGKTYLSESTPITVSRIPSGTYKISVRKDDAVGEYTFTTAPGTQNVSIMAINTPMNDWDLSNMGANYTWYSMEGVVMDTIVIMDIHDITGNIPTCAELEYTIENSYASTNGRITIEDNNPNITLPEMELMQIDGEWPESINVVLYDADGNVIGTGSAECINDGVA